MRPSGRWTTAVVIAASSHPALATVATAVTALVLTPLLEALLIVAIGSVSGLTDIRDIAYCGVLVGFGLGVLAGTVEQVTADRRLGVLHEVVAFGMSNGAYWAGKLVVTIILGSVPALFGVITVYLVDDTHDGGALLRVVLMIPVVAVSAGLCGLAAALGSLGLSNPYLIVNTASTVLLITAGAIAPVSVYPEWLRWLCQALPFTAVIDAARGGADPGLSVLREVLVAGGWLLVGTVAARHAVRSIRSGASSQEVW